MRKSRMGIQKAAKMDFHYSSNLACPILLGFGGVMEFRLPPSPTGISFKFHLIFNLSPQSLSLEGSLGESVLLKVEPQWFIWTAESSHCILLMSYVSDLQRAHKLVQCRKLVTDSDSFCRSNSWWHPGTLWPWVTLLYVTLYSKGLTQKRKNCTNRANNLLFHTSINHQERNTMTDVLTPNNRPVLRALGSSMDKV